MIKKVLIANRGEIAVRIVRACAEMGIRSVAVYADADRHALHVKKADEAYSLGPDTVAGYLNAHRLVNIAAASGCDGLHPGYGFLSENPELAEICARRGIRFIGPSAAVIRSMGDKTAARKAMISAGVPVTPGTENLNSLQEAREAAETLGYPVMLKATSGGGGRGIRRCESHADLEKNFQRVISEATKAFGSADIFMEKCIVNPRHIEVQILADAYGNAIHLFERDCSIQRRHQKLIEIAPSPQLSEEQRQLLGEYAVRAAKHVGYVNAGTVEFLLDAHDNVYFMEMNTRLQVEHPVTEQVTGVDIVKEQIRIAADEELSMTQDKMVAPRGMAMEFRINAEDPKNGFLPSFGKITRYFAPGGPGIRTDGCIYTGYQIPPYYDSMCAKLIVWASTWEELLARSERALRDIGVYGIKTTIPYQLEILKTEEFRSGHFNTGFVEQHPELTHYSVRRPQRELAAVVAAAITASMGH
jgi:pyruvate carboxylase subunit A